MPRDFSKYYDLEKYLLTDVRNRYVNGKTISPADFYMLLHWKAKRAKNKHRDRLAEKYGQFDAAVKAISDGLRERGNAKDGLKFLMGDGGFYLATASAILTVFFPKEFTVYDERVCGELNGFHQLSYRKFSDRLWDDYQRYVQAVKSAVPEKRNLRDKDRYLWGRSFYNDVRDAPMPTPKASRTRLTAVEAMPPAIIAPQDIVE